MFGPIDPTRRNTPQKEVDSNSSVHKGQSEKPKAATTHSNFDELFSKDLFSHNAAPSKKPANDLFACNNEDDWFSNASKQTPKNNKTLSSLFDEDDDDLFSIKTTTSNKKSSFPVSSFFDDNDELFLSTPAKTTSKSQKAATLDFLNPESEPEIDDDGSLFGGNFKFTEEDIEPQKPLEKPTPRPDLSPNIRKALNAPPAQIDESNHAYLNRLHPGGSWPALADLKPIEDSKHPQFLDPNTGKKYTQTIYDSEESALNAYGAEQLHRKAGNQLPPSKIIQTESGYVKLTQSIETQPLSDVLESASQQEKNALLKQVHEQFAINALLGCTNLDVSMFGVDSNGYVIQLEIPDPFFSESDYPMEFWNMRNPEKSPETSKLFKGLNIYSIASQIESLHSNIEDLINSAPPEHRAIFAGRLSQMRDISQQALEMEHDHFKASYTDEMLMHRMGLREAGISAQMPQVLNQHPGEYIVTDENGVEFDNLRRKEEEPKDTQTIPYQIGQYMLKHGGDPLVIDTWTCHQGINSWSDGAQAAKYFFAQQKDISMDEYYWHSGKDKAESCYRKRANETFGTSLTMWHAANQELLANTDFRFNDRSKHQVRITRTEGYATLSKNGIVKEGTYPRYKMGPNESGSIFTSVKAYAGNSITTQQVPHHAITACYLLGAPPDKIGSPFVNDKENEFLFMPQGIDVTYVNARNHDVTGTQQDELNR